ncbi:DUF3008 family protein [Falsirhodobacter deserti]|uniref:DUF3008 family protein n=1 Tax=Falsirhodobacter deserti TaxID=1365611 RepID=UPI000FE4390D|nr:DUF3008 family protein [Falsirhodobacter deserti]
MNAQVRSEYFTECAGAALSARRGLLNARALNHRSRDMYDMLTLAELEEMAPPDLAGPQRPAG